MIPGTKLPPRIRVIRHIDSSRKISPGLASGIRAIEHAEAASTAILLDDMPWVSGNSLHHLLGLISPERIVVPTFRGVRGAHFVFKSHFWQTLNLLIEEDDRKKVPQADLHFLELSELSDTGNQRCIGSERCTESQ